MSTFGEMQARIADEIMRADLTTQVRREIVSAIQHYRSERLWFNEARVFTTTSPDQQNYPLPSINGRKTRELDEVTITVNDNRYPLNRRSWEWFLDMDRSTTTTIGVPDDFSIYDYQLWLYPTPNAAYTLTLYVSQDEASLTSDGASNSWMTDGEELIRNRAKWGLYANVIHETEEAGIAKAMELDALGRLRQEQVQLVSSHKIKPTYF